ncbi:hypothetical protein XH80_08185 [Bradyrhizobium sp. CCBAU 45384]|nr:hypothetical protein [Bradyrhizobium sp. CCBAU 45384]
MRYIFAQQTAGAKPAPGLPCALLIERVIKQSSGDMSREEAKACLRLELLATGDAIVGWAKRSVPTTSTW